MQHILGSDGYMSCHIHFQQYSTCFHQFMFFSASLTILHNANSTQPNSIAKTTKIHDHSSNMIACAMINAISIQFETSNLFFFFCIKSKQSNMININCFQAKKDWSITINSLFWNHDWTKFFSSYCHRSGWSKPTFKCDDMSITIKELIVLHSWKEPSKSSSWGILKIWSF